ncbi:MAG TPA: hypothetical protein VMT32_09480 [Bryobacteraceae bacterium]|nr:hypothetical protein [Bryobacteraceae bacterium]
MLALLFACAVLPAQEWSPRARQFKPPENWLNFNFSNVQPPAQGWFRPNLANVQPRYWTLTSPPGSDACSVPLLEAPVNPNIDPKISVPTGPGENIDNMPIAKGLPPCPSRDAQPEVLFVPRTK